MRDDRLGAGFSSPWLIAVCAYSALTIAYLWPLVTHLSSALPHDAIDPVLNAAILSWDAHRLPLSTAWWNAPMFWPLGGALALSEHLLGVSVLTTPLQWAGATPLTAYNIAFIAAFPLSALAAHALAFAVVKRHDAAALAGCIFGFNPYRVAQFPHLQVMWACGMPLALWSLHKFVERRDRRWLVIFGAACLAQAAFNGYYMLFLPILLAGWTMWFARDLKVVLSIAATWFVAMIALVPVLLGYSQFHRTLALQRTIEEIEQFSAHPMSVFVASPDLWLWRPIASAHAMQETQLFPGAVALTLIVVAAVVAGFASRTSSASGDHRWAVVTRVALMLSSLCAAGALSALALDGWQWTVGSTTIVAIHEVEKPLSLAAAFLAIACLSSRRLRSAWQHQSAFAFYGIAAAAMLVLSVGPRPSIGSVHFYRAPYYWLLQLPGFSELRAPGRIGMLFALCVAVAAAIGFARLTASLTERSMRALATIAIVLVLVESWPRLTLAIPAPAIAGLSGLEPGVPVLELPLGITERDADAVYRALAHHHPTVNGYSGYVPSHYYVLTAALQAGDRGVIPELARDRDLLVVLDRRVEFERWTAIVGPHPVVADSGNYRILRVSRSLDRRPEIGAALPVQSVTADRQGEQVSRMLDRDLQTAWSTGRMQSGGESLLIDLGRTADVSAVRLSQGPYTMDFPRGLAVDCAADRDSWSSCWTGSSTALAVRGLLDDPRTGTLTIPVSAHDVRYLRVRQTGADAVNGWAVAELAVFGRQP
jgi:hypothetical protein